MDSDSLKAQLASVERQIGDKQQKIQVDDAAAQKEQTRLQVDIASAQKYLSAPETEPGQHASWQQRVTTLQSQLDQEMQKIQSTRAAHQADLDALNRQKTDLQTQIGKAEQRENMIRMAAMMPPPQQ